MGKDQTIDHPFQLSSTAQPGKYQIPIQLALVPAGVKDAARVPRPRNIRLRLGASPTDR
jgi:hypothetical protein